MNAAALLRTVKTIIERPETWCQGSRIQSSGNNVQRCILGAFDHARSWAGYRLLALDDWTDLRQEAVTILAEVRPRPTQYDPFNDAGPGQSDGKAEWRAAHINNVSTHPEVMEWINEAIESASISDRDNPTVPSR